MSKFSLKTIFYTFRLCILIHTSYSFASCKSYKYEYPSSHTKPHLSIMKEISKFPIYIMVLHDQELFPLYAQYTRAVMFSRTNTYCFSQPKSLWGLLLLTIHILLDISHNCHFPVAFNSCKTKETWKLMLPPHDDMFLITISGLCENSCETTLFHLITFHHLIHSFT